MLYSNGRPSQHPTTGGGHEASQPGADLERQVELALATRTVARESATKTPSVSGLLLSGISGVPTYHQFCGLIVLTENPAAARSTCSSGARTRLETGAGTGSALHLRWGAADAAAASWRAAMMVAGFMMLRTAGAIVERGNTVKPMMVRNHSSVGVARLWLAFCTRQSTSSPSKHWEMLPASDT